MQNEDTSGSRGRKTDRHARRKRRKPRAVLSHPPDGRQAEAERVGREKDPVQDKGKQEADVRRGTESGSSSAWPLPPCPEHECPSSCMLSNREGHTTCATEFRRVDITAHLSFDYLDLSEEHTLQPEDMRTAVGNFLLYGTWWAASSARRCYAKGCDRPARTICGRCHAVRFCSPECISADWKRTDSNGHRACCKPLRLVWKLASKYRAPLTDAESALYGALQFDIYLGLRRLLRSFRIPAMEPRFLLRGYIVSTDAPQDEALAFLYRATYCWATPPEEARLRSLHPRTRTLVTALRSLHRCCQAEVIILLFDGRDKGTAASSWASFTIPPCPCHDHEACLRAVAAADPGPSAAELLRDYASLWQGNMVAIEHVRAFEKESRFATPGSV